jgi:predicted GIY-YIG superfamily endonuclease
METKWSVYLIYNVDAKRTYIGATTDVRRRLRQHKGELVGGARSTTKLGPNWRLICCLTGFQDRKEAYRWEKLLKSRARGYTARIIAFANIMLGICPTFGKRPLYQVPKGLTLLYEEAPKSPADSTQVSAS